MRIERNSDILLINMPMDRVLNNREEHSVESSMPPLGLMYIYSYLKKNNYSISFIDLAVEIFDIHELYEKIQYVNPKIVGISTYGESWNSQLLISKKIKELIPSVKIVAGGHGATFSYEDLLNTQVIDYVIAGEGENGFNRLADYIIKGESDLDSIPGLIYKKGEGFIINNNNRMLDLDELPFPDRDILDLETYSYPYTISTARGCPGRCIFCSSHAFWGNKVTMRSPESIIEEIKHLYFKYSMKSFFIVDDTFTLLPKRTMEFCNKLLEFSEAEGINFKWGCESRADVVSDELLQLMKKVGCNMIQFGMESGNNEVLKKINKNVRYEQIENAVKIAYKYGISTNVSIIIGHHVDTRKTVEETLEKAKFLKENYKANVIFSINTPYPGTELRKILDDNNVKLLVKNNAQLRVDRPSFETSLLSANEIRKYFMISQNI